MKSIIDNFSEQAKTYSKFRPVYPESLYEFIYSHVKNFDSAWDCGTGNGQVAVELSKKFKTVFASDISDSQLAEAIAKPNIFYSNTRAEKTDFPDNSFDLISVAQAYHWFDEDAFALEVKRIAKPGAVLAVWAYSLLKITPEIDAVIDEIYNGIVGKYWDTGRKMIEEEYCNIRFPFEEIQTPRFDIEDDWTLERLKGYFDSWSATSKYKKVTGKNPLELIEPKLDAVWGNKETYPIKFPLFLRLGKVEK